MCQRLKALIYILFKFLCIFHLYNAFFFCVSFRNVETGFSKRPKEYVLIKCLQSISGTSFRVVNSSILHTQQICSHFRYTINHIHKALGALPSLAVTHEEIKSSKAGRTLVRWQQKAFGATQILSIILQTHFPAQLSIKPSFHPKTLIS